MLDDLIDDMIMLFTAAQKTTQVTITNFIATLCHEKDVYRRLIDVIDPFMRRVEGNLMEDMT